MPQARKLLDLDAGLDELDALARKLAYNEVSEQDAHQQASEICTRFGPTVVTSMINWFQRSLRHEQKKLGTYQP